MTTHLLYIGPGSEISAEPFPWLLVVAAVVVIGGVVLVLGGRKK